MALKSRFWLFWIRKTIRNVTTVVPVLITSCQVSEKWKSGPVAAHTITISAAAMKAQGVPTAFEVRWESLRKNSCKACVPPPSAG